MDLIEQQRFSELFDRSAPAVLAYLLRRTDRATAEDVLSETFLVAWRRRGELSQEPLPWLYAVARRVLANQLRGQGRQRAVAERLALQPSGSSVEDAGWVLEALQQLSPADQEVLRLDAWEELSREQAALVLGCRPATYAVRLHRARGRLRQVIQARRPAAARTSLPSESRT